MIAVPPGPTFAAIAAAVAFAAGVAGGWTWERRAREAEVAEIRAGIARREAEAAETSRRRLEAARQAADAAIKDRDARIGALDAAHRRLTHALKTATTGRPCLSAAARGLLQQSPAFGLKLPAAAGGVTGAHAAPAADSGGASTDADLAGWIIDAAGLYEACRARIDALRQWDEGVADGR